MTMEEVVLLVVVVVGEMVVIAIKVALVMVMF